MTRAADINVAIVGATGAVGREALGIIEQRGLPWRVHLLASARSAGTIIEHRGQRLVVQELTEGSFRGIDIAIFATGGSISRRYAAVAVECGATVVDNSSAFRMDEHVPLVIPEINGDVLAGFEGPGIVASPNCSTTIVLMAVTPLHRAVGSGGIERMVISTYQSASGAGAAAMAELEQQAHDYVHSRPLTQEVFGRPYLFNLFSHDSRIGREGYNEEEMKLVRETGKIWDGAAVSISATCVRVPVLRAHCAAVNVTFNGILSEADARAALAAAPGVRIVDDREGNIFPEPLGASGMDQVLVGRIRGDISSAAGKGLDLFVAGDQLRKGAALNAVQIAERVAEGMVR